MKTAIERHREIWQGKSDEWLFERLDNEVKQKVEEINSLLHSINELQAIRYINLTVYVNEISSDVITIHNQYGNPFDKKFRENNKATLHRPFQVLQEITIEEAMNLLRDNRWKPITYPLITIKTR